MSNNNSDVVADPDRKTCCTFINTAVLNFWRGWLPLNHCTSLKNKTNIYMYSCNKNGHMNMYVVCSIPKWLCAHSFVYLLLISYFDYSFVCFALLHIQLVVVMIMCYHCLLLLILLLQYVPTVALQPVSQWLSRLHPIRVYPYPVNHATNTLHCSPSS